MPYLGFKFFDKKFQLLFQVHKILDPDPGPARRTQVLNFLFGKNVIHAHTIDIKIK